MSRPAEPYGLFGGTFDPVHFGHLRAALEVRRKLGLQRLHLLPAGTPPHRSSPVASAAHRLAMLQLATQSFPGFAIDDREVKRSGPSYMVETLDEIRKEHPSRSVLLIIGQDAVNALDSWYQWHRLFELAHLVVLRRPGSASGGSAAVLEEVKGRQVHDVAALNESKTGCILHLDVTQLEISSTGIRAELARGVSPRFLLPERVLDYIDEHKLYCAA